MQFERIRKNKKRKIVIGGILLVCIISAITITTSRAKYKLTQDIPLVRGYINYIADREKPIITNVTTTVTKTEINVSVTASDNVGVTEYWYQIGTNTAVKGTGNTHKFTGLSAETIYTIKVYVKDAAGNQSDITTKSVATAKPSGSEIILNNITVKTNMPDFSQTATTDEGVYKVSDGMYGGYSYYWRGAVTNNYVKFGGFCWRIIRINGDGTIRLIYDGRTCHANGTNTTESIAVTNVKYNTSWNSTSYAGWTYTLGLQRTLEGTASNAKIQTDNWYNTNLSDYESKIADGKFCNDRSTSTSWESFPRYTLYFGGSSRNGVEKVTRINPSLSCLNEDIYVLKVGAIIIDEVAMAGATKNSSNGLYYLYNGQNYWTMSPALWWSSSEDGESINVFNVMDSGIFGYSYIFGVATTSGIRPVINLKSDITFSSGNGTLNNPYVVE